VASPFFVVEMFELKESQNFRTKDSRTKESKSSVQILVAVEGCAAVEARGTEPVTLAKGDAVVVPASVEDFDVHPQWTVEFLKASLPSSSVPEPETRI
jgi:mannose-6-phosphate isomerase class I